MSGMPLAAAAHVGEHAPAQVPWLQASECPDRITNVGP